MSTEKQIHQWRMPAEWGPHRRCWMAWPCNEALWPDGLEEPRRAYALVARIIASLEEVAMLARPEDVDHASELCGKDNIRFLPCPLDDSWLRDSGPTFVFNAQGRPAGVNWIFNGWGEKHPHSQDARLAASILSYEGVEILPSSLIMEGGALHVDGGGTLMITEESMRHRYRDQEFDRGFIEGELKHLLGIDKILWLPWGLADDDTAGHVDNVACFTAPGKVLALTAIDREDPDHERLQANLDYLRSESDASGQPLQIETISQPRPRKHPHGHRLSQSYINFYLPNDGVVLPLFNDEEKDWEAQRILRRHFPQRQLITIPGTAIAAGGGNVHCITQQQPDPASRRH